MKKYLWLLILAAICASGVGNMKGNCSFNEKIQAIKKSDVLERDAADNKSLDIVENSDTDIVKTETTEETVFEVTENIIVKSNNLLLFEKEVTTDTTDKQEPTTEVAPVIINIYSANENWDGYSIDEVSVESVTPFVIWDILKSYRMVPPGAQVNSLTKIEVNGEKYLELDITEDFLIYIRGLGTAGEGMVMGSIVNTFIDAYGVTRVRVMVEGEGFVSGHAEYYGYMEHQY